ncbi:MAG: NAD-dependent epimerase/dehydratase family protein, partial [bacterium]|nr:NAD-dependent epimerase/dehydratase family protein [bacterium]
MKKPVLITGANGFTGRVLLKTLEGSDWEIIPMVHSAAGLKNEILSDFCHHRFPLVLRDLPAVDAVVHLGTRVGWDGSSREELFKPNVLATGQLVEWARQQKAY